MAMSESDLAKRAALKKTGKWFAGTQAKADRRQYNRLSRRYKAQGEVTLDPVAKAWVLPQGAQSNSLARDPNGNILVPTKSSLRKLA